MIYGYTDDLFGKTGLHAQEVYEFKDDKLKRIVIGVDGLLYDLVEESYENIYNINISEFESPDIDNKENFYASWSTEYSDISLMIGEDNCIVIGITRYQTAG